MALSYIDEDSIRKQSVLFDKVDLVRTGGITRKEFRLFLKDSSEKEANEIFDKLDVYKQGKIEYSDFLKASIDFDEVINK